MVGFLWRMQRTEKVRGKRERAVPPNLAVTRARDPDHGSVRFAKTLEPTPRIAVSARRARHRRSFTTPVVSVIVPSDTLNHSHVHATAHACGVDICVARPDAGSAEGAFAMAYVGDNEERCGTLGIVFHRVFEAVATPWAVVRMFLAVSEIRGFLKVGRR
jgi:hypothetical protein